MTNPAAQEMARLSNAAQKKRLGEEGYRQQRREAGRLGGEAKARNRKEALKGGEK